MTRPRVFAPWTPSADSLALVEQVRDALPRRINAALKEGDKLRKRAKGLS